MAVKSPALPVCPRPWPGPTCVEECEVAAGGLARCGACGRARGRPCGVQLVKEAYPWPRGWRRSVGVPQWPPGPLRSCGRGDSGAGGVACPAQRLCRGRWLEGGVVPWPAGPQPVACAAARDKRRAIGSGGGRASLNLKVVVRGPSVVATGSSARGRRRSTWGRGHCPPLH
ncbi:hypothetical protein NDU88_005162 [Pleurodeles waltl]|uniref:Uncharacterized protein n=1 Tax=Pleurodeles waltl TaxID=8319 RepID=A0AAV7TTI7_PLEWA|nr:hypothetical protein NDU88_005162 [Pleurodeles waltl]